MHDEDKRIPFDTHELIKQLKQHGFSDEMAEGMSIACQTTIKNTYSQHEVDMMYQQALSKFEQSQAEDRARSDQRFAEERSTIKEMIANFKETIVADRAHHEKEMLKLENRFEKSLNSVMYKIISVLGGIVVLTGAIASLWHYLG